MKGIFSSIWRVAVALVLVLSLGLFMAAPAMATAATAVFAPVSGPVGTTVTVTGTGWVASETIAAGNVTVGGATATHTLTVNGAGVLTGTITVPTVTVGLKYIAITGSASGTQTFPSAFTVTTTTAVFDPVSGPVGTVIAVTGTGWAGNETIAAGNVTVGNITATHTLTVNGGGVLSGNITVPATVAIGNATIVITGATSGAQTFADAFEVKAATAIFNPAYGPVRTVIAVTGAYWWPSEAIAAGNVTVGNITATHTLTVNGSGVLSGNITVPATVATGNATIVITGATSGAQTFADAFEVKAATAIFNPAYGPVRTVIAVTGAYWWPSEAIAAGNVTVGNITATHTLTVNGSGVLSGNITVPATVAIGNATIVITGATSGAQTFAGAFTVTTATAVFDPVSGPVDTVIAVTGTGWVASDTIAAGNVTVGNITATHTLTVNGSGVLSGNITVPTLAVGLKTIVITGATSGAQTFTGAFTVTAAATFTPTHGPVGTVIAVTGTGWTGNETIAAGNVTVGGVTATHHLTVNVGTLTGNITVPTVAVGLKTIVITGATSGAQTFADAFTVTATATFTPTHGPVGTVIAVTGTGWTGNETIAAGNVTVGGATATHHLTVNGAGNLTGNITVPTLASGLKTIVITGASSGAQTFADAFTVTATATFTPTHGPVGTVIAVTGTGWTGNETIAAGNVTVGNATATHTLTVNGAGELTGNITVPTLAVGLKTIVITGNTSGAQTFTDAFTVTAAATFTPDEGPVGTVIAVTGTGWTGNETIAAGNVTVGGVTATHHLTVNVGTLTGNITVPTVAVGLKTIVITGASSGAQTFTGAFTVTAAATFTPTHGPVGTVIAVTGTGWTGNETIAAGNVTVGGTTATHHLTVNGAGNLTGNITVPTLASGLKTIVITGNTSGAQVFADAFTVTAAATFTPTHGPVGTVIAVTGTGWAASETIAAGNVTVGNATATHTLTVNGNGTLTGNITVPTLAIGLKTIVITGSESGNQTFTGAFTVTATVTLSAGWNLLSTPIKLDADGDALGQIFDAESLSNIEVSYRWDAVNQVWAQVVSTDYQFLPLEAVYMKVKSGVSATAEFMASEGLSAPPSRVLRQGLNLIGPAPALEAGVFPATPLDEALVSIKVAAGGLSGYSMVISPGLNQPGWTYALGGDVQNLLPFKGYWVVMDNADTLYGFSTTPISQ